MFKIWYSFHETFLALFFSKQICVIYMKFSTYFILKRFSQVSIIKVHILFYMITLIVGKSVNKMKISQYESFMCCCILSGNVFLSTNMDLIINSFRQAWYTIHTLLSSRGGWTQTIKYSYCDVLFWKWHLSFQCYWPDRTEILNMFYI